MRKFVYNKGELLCVIFSLYFIPLHFMPVILEGIVCDLMCVYIYI